MDGERSVERCLAMELWSSYFEIYTIREVTWIVVALIVCGPERACRGMP